MDAETNRAVLVSILMPGLFEGESWYEFPPATNMSGLSGDAEQAAFLAKRLRLDYIGWLLLVNEARRMTSNRLFRRLLVRIADRLEEVEVLDRDDLLRIYDAVREETTCST